jgi:uncharacterized membrane protein SpoIIM required for sporulation
VIIDLERFVAEERKYWTELEKILARLEEDVAAAMSLEDVMRFHYLYQRASAGLARVKAAAPDPDLRLYLETLVGRAYGEIHETRQRPHKFAPFAWFFGTFPRTFRRHFAAFRLTLAAMLVGSLFGAATLALDPADKEILLPFEHLLGSPAERVAREERQANPELEGRKVTFSSQLMTHNTQVAIFSLASGVTWGVGTLLLMFYNGVILGAVAFDYVTAGKSAFLMGWLLPHGAVEIPAILLAGQGGLVLAGALLGRGSGIPLGGRLRLVWADLVTLIGGVAIMLVWAGLIEGLFSQYHEPVLPYGLKIGFGVVELAALTLFLGLAGAKKRDGKGAVTHG